MDQSIVGTGLLILTGLFSYKGFKDLAFFEHYLFNVDKILLGKEYRRMLSSGFLHSGWFHYAFNMIALIGFAAYLESYFGIPKLLFIYFVSLLGGNLLALYIHRNHGDYRAIGASGAVSGVIFSSIILDPLGKIGFVLIPIEFSSWILGILFVLVSIFGIKGQIGNIGHEAHLGGALTGILITILLQPSIVATNWWIILLLALPTIAFLILIVRNPAVLMVDQYWGEGFTSLKERFKQKTAEKEEMPPQEEMDMYLEKIKKSGFKSLSDKEKKRLNELRDKIS